MTRAQAQILGNLREFVIAVNELCKVSVVVFTETESYTVLTTGTVN